MGEGATFRERKKTQVSCTKCGVTVATSYLKTYTEITHDICVPQTRGVEEVRGGTTTYMVSLYRMLQEVKCPMLGCPEVAHSAGRIREHIM